ncbi:MAG TPA: aldehyde dehydrogenase family protein, partial [Vicinamibacterales bacterium]|nr:aldehyde dehydrogenase family protein [Vicinamibacterales bacterium]
MSADVREALSRLGVVEPLRGVSIGSAWIDGGGAALTSRSPIDGKTLAQFHVAARAQVDEAATRASEAFAPWRLVPAPIRGHFVRAFADRLRRHKDDLAALVTLEAGKITQEALGEVQEMIDICEFAVGLSRQLYGKT